MHKATKHLSWILTALVAIVGAYVTFQTALNLDVGFFLLAARSVADGRILYETFPDYSMPANVWIALFSLHIANLTGILLAYVHQAVLLSLTAAGAILTGIVVSRTAGPRTLTGRAMPPLIMALFLIIPGYDSGQRDVLFIVLAAPLVAITAARHFGLVPGWRLSSGIVALAAIGASLKPQYFLPLLALGGCDLALRRGRPGQIAGELWALAVILACYGVVVQVIYPTYFFQVLPNAAKFYAFQKAWIVSLILVLRVAAAAGAASAVLLLAILRERALSNQPIPWGIVAAWAVFGISLLVVYYVQHMGFRYHRVPPLLYGLVSMALFAVMSIEIGIRRWTAGYRLRAIVLGFGATAISLAVIAMAALAPTRNFNLPGTSRADCLGDPVTRIFRSLPSASYVLSLQTGVPPISPLHAYADVRWSGEFGSLQEISAIVLEAAKDVAAGRERDPYFVALERHVREAVVRSLTLRPPRIVLVDVTVPLRWFEHFNQPFSLLPWLNKDPAFVAAWANYEYVETVPSFEGVTVEVWRQRDHPGSQS